MSGLNKDEASAGKVLLVSLDENGTVETALIFDEFLAMMQ